jgi:hypothetical protein
MDNLTALSKYFDLMNEQPSLFVIPENCDYEIITDPDIIMDYVYDTKQEIGIVFEDGSSMTLCDLILDSCRNYLISQRSCPVL